MKGTINCDEFDYQEEIDMQILPDVGDQIILDENSLFVEYAKNFGMGFTVKKRVFFINNTGYEDEVMIEVSINPVLHGRTPK